MLRKKNKRRKKYDDNCVLTSPNGRPRNGWCQFCQSGQGKMQAVTHAQQSDTGWSGGRGLGLEHHCPFAYDSISDEMRVACLA
jgi:hypothetical protein